MDGPERGRIESGSRSCGMSIGSTSPIIIHINLQNLLTGKDGLIQWRVGTFTSLKIYLNNPNSFLVYFRDITHFNDLFLKVSMLAFLVSLRNPTAQFILIIHFEKQELKINYFPGEELETDPWVKMLGAHAQQPWLRPL